MSGLTAASCFSGIGGAELALPEADWLWSAEIEPFPCAVLERRFGHPNLGDITAPDFIDRAKAFGRLDLLCGGPPCQAFSIAGLRKGMLDPRGLLSLRFIQVADELASTVGLGNLLVENVPGWLSHPENAFGCFLGGLVGADDALPNPAGGSWPREGMAEGPRARAAWRILDAQYAGLAQRRERVFLVADFGDGADPVEVLFERKGVRGNPPPRRETGQGVAGTLSARTQGEGGLGTDFECQGGLRPVRFGGNNTSGPIDVAARLTAKGQRIDFEVETFLAEPAHTLRAEGFDASEDGTGRGTPLVPACFNSREDPCVTGDLAGSLGASSPQAQAIAFALRGRDDGAMPEIHGDGDLCGALRSASGGSTRDYIAIQDQWAVRRLTPTEAERLQGYPDGWTLIETGKRRTVEQDEAEYLIAKGAHVVCDNEGRWRTNAAADGPRYKALGNAWAVSCVRPIALNIYNAITGAAA